LQDDLTLQGGKRVLFVMAAEAEYGPHLRSLIGLRGISDGAAELRHVSDWTEYLHVIDEKLAYAVDSLAIQLEQGSLAL
jgi:hypothetical protein